MEQTACCAKCHFRWEEREIIPLLPPDVQSWILEEHEAIRRLGFPRDLVLEHAEREMAAFRAYCPAYLVAKVEADHEHVENLENLGFTCKCMKAQGMQPSSAATSSAAST